MTNSERQALATLAVMSAMADGTKSEAERAALERMTGQWVSAGVDVGRALQDALLQRISVRDVASRLVSSESRQSAYEIAVSVCRADDALRDEERAFLGELRSALHLPDEVAAVTEQEADRIGSPPVLEAPIVPVGGKRADDGKSILNYALLAGALEMLPNSLATMAIIPLQMRMVYTIGKDHGYELDRGHVKDFLATVGVGLSAQVVEGFAVRFLSGLAGKAFGKIGRTVAGQVASSAIAFATTYALGHAARQYYAGGRRLGAVELKGLFDQMLGEGRTLQSRYLPQIREQAGRIRMNELLPLIRGVR